MQDTSSCIAALLLGFYSSVSCGRFHANTHLISPSWKNTTYVCAYLVCTYISLLYVLIILRIHELSYIYTMMYVYPEHESGEKTPKQNKTATFPLFHHRSIGSVLQMTSDAVESGNHVPALMAFVLRFPFSSARDTVIGHMASLGNCLGMQYMRSVVVALQWMLYRIISI